MSKYKREEDLNEKLEKEVRELKFANRSLLKQLKKLNKGYRKLRDDDKITDEDVPEQIEKMCWDCGIGEYRAITIMNRRFRKCQNCGKQGKVSIVK